MSEERCVISATRRSMKELVDGTIRVSLDIDPQFRDDFFRLFGQIDMPVALAPLTLAASLPNERSASNEDRLKGWKSLGPIAQSAVLVCQEEAFQQFAAERYENLPGRSEEDNAAEYVKFHCKVDSRKDLDTADGAKTRYGALMADYKEWQRGNT